MTEMPSGAYGIAYAVSTAREVSSTLSDPNAAHMLAEMLEENGVSAKVVRKYTWVDQTWIVTQIMGWLGLDVEIGPHQTIQRGVLTTRMVVSRVRTGDRQLPAPLAVLGKDFRGAYMWYVTYAGLELVAEKTKDEALRSWAQTAIPSEPAVI